MFEVIQSDAFDKWLNDLKDRRAVAKINARLTNMSLGNFGDVKPTTEGVSETRINYGPGYRIYFKQYGSVIIVVLAAGTKKTQDKNINKAIEISKEYK